MHISTETESEKAVWKIPSADTGFQLEIWGKVLPSQQQSFYFSLSSGGGRDEDLMLYGNKKSDGGSFEIQHGKQSSSLPFLTGEDFYVKFSGTSNSWTVTVNDLSETWRYETLSGYDMLSIAADDRSTSMVVSAVRVNDELWGNNYMFTMGN